MPTLGKDRRRQLESTVREARRVAEEGASKSLEQLAVAHARAPANLTSSQAKRRNALRAHGRQLGDLRNQQTGEQGINRLTAEFAYEHWHRMLFARFLAENDLLIEPGTGIAITLAECQELAREKNEDWLALASRYAQTMLPQIFRAGDPVLEVSLPPETRSELEDLLKELPREVFTAEDSLGWVYQFWQADNKDAVNRSERKIGADELPAVTQLFTEDYMVWFLLHNTLGAWWAGKVLAAQPQLASVATEAQLRAACAVGGIEWTYLRFIRQGEQPWRPVAGCFPAWPKAAKDIALLDPCMGSGHFLVFALPILAAIRGQEEKLTPDAAIEAVLRDNLYGLELDPRCTQIAAFNLALAAWKRTGYRKLPALHLACSGLSLGVARAEWLRLAEQAAAEQPAAADRGRPAAKNEEALFSDAVRRGFEGLYEVFVKAPTLGSLINPLAAGDLIQKGFADLEPLLAGVLAKQETAEVSEMAVAAKGLAKAAEILGRRFTLVATNVPYVGRGKQDEALKTYCDRTHPDAKADLATCFVERGLDFCAKGGAVALVTPQNWLTQDGYRALRERLLKDIEWSVVARLGERGFESPQAAGAFTALMVLTVMGPAAGHALSGLDVSEQANPWEKNEGLRTLPFTAVSQAGQSKNPDSRIILSERSSSQPLSALAATAQGIKSGDEKRFRRHFWEVGLPNNRWRFYQGSVKSTCTVGGLDGVIDWTDDGRLLARRQGVAAWGRDGVMVSQMRELPVARYFGDIFDSNASPIVPNDPKDLAAIWAFCSDSTYHDEVRKLDQSLKPTNRSLVQVPFDLVHWREVAEKKFPHGLPTPETPDPTQWLFGGHPRHTTSALQVAVARLVGYRWPRQCGIKLAGCPSLKSDGLEQYADEDGIVPLVAIKGEASAAERLVELMSAAYGGDWSAATLATAIADTGHAGSTLESWLLDHFFADHCALFEMPFVWHIWDGRRDGFNALVNYHRLVEGDGKGRRLLEKLTHTYLGDWIDRQRADQKAGREGADGRLAAAEHLRDELQKILEGEAPYDIFVRWKPLSQQPIGWDPDINDGVRVNVRPFMTARTFGARGASSCILRARLPIAWSKDGGKEDKCSVKDFPWYWGWDESERDFEGGDEFDGNRWNDLHYTLAHKREARGGK